MNRGLAKRPLFESRADMRYFLSRLAREVRRGRLEVAAYCLMTTHYHLLVRSPRGELSEALRRAQNEYVRTFNRRHRRDGTLVRGRFTSRPIHDLKYRSAVLLYIDRNPVEAGMCWRIGDYPFCSAAHYRRRSGPRWLARSWVEDHVAKSLGLERYDSAAYGRFAEARATRGSSLVVERRIERGDRARRVEEAFDDLVGRTPEYVRDWLRRKALLADGHEVGSIVLDRESLLDEVTAQADRIDSWCRGRDELGERRPDGRGALLSGLGRRLAGLKWSEVATLVEASPAAARNLAARHRDWTVTDPAYLDVATSVAARALQRCHGPDVRSRTKSSTSTAPPGVGELRGA